MSKFDQRRQPVLTPALEGSKEIQPANSFSRFANRPSTQGGRVPFSDREQFGQLPFTPGGGHPPRTPGGGHPPRTPGGMAGPFHRGFYSGGYFPPLRPQYINVMPGEMYQVPTIMPRQRMPYAGPPSLMPHWGGYSVGGQYFPEEKKRQRELTQDSERNIIPVPIRAPKQAPPPPPQQMYNVHPPPPPRIPVPIIIRMAKSRPIRVPPILPKKPVKKNSKRTFPGSESLRRFRHVALAVAFIAHLRANVKKSFPNRPSSTFLFGIILKEIVAALHRIYLNPNGNIYPVLNDIIGPNCYDLASLVHGGQIDAKEESVLIQELQYVVENICYHITEIMPGTGVLGTHRKSAVFELIRSGKRFPNGYFWKTEMQCLNFTENGRTHNVTDSESFLLMLGIFISRSLVTTILMKPIDYGLSSEVLSEVAERNLRIVASTILFLVRRIALQRGRGIMEMPEEIGKYLYSDQEMQHVYGKLSRTFNYCEGLLREWGTEYIRRLRACSQKN